MNCRRVNSLLSAYLDGELTGAEMIAIREHMRGCACCCEEHEALSQTKRLVASLALKAPRAELEALLLREAASVNQSWVSRFQWLPAWITDRAEGLTAPPATMVAPPRIGLLRVKPIAATAVLSVAGFCLASATVDSPSRLAAPSAELADLLPVSPAGSTGSIATIAASSEFREVQSFSASSMLSTTAAVVPVGYTSLPAGTVMGSGEISSPAASLSAPRMMSSPASLSAGETVSPAIWQAGAGQGSSVLLSVQRAFFPR